MRLPGRSVIQLFIINCGQNDAASAMINDAPSNGQDAQSSDRRRVSEQTMLWACKFKRVLLQNLTEPYGQRVVSVRKRC